MPAWWGALAVGVAAAVAVGACATGQLYETSSVANPASAVLVPGTRELATASFTDERETDQVVGDSGPGTTVRVVGAAAMSIEPQQYRGRAALLLTRMARRGTAEFFDTTLVLRDGLVPVWETSSSSRGVRVHYDYDGATVRLVSTSADSTHRAAHTYPHPVFHFNELDAIVRAVPLRSGYRVIVPLYSEGDDSLEMDTISVAPRQGTAVWDVRFGDRVIVTHYGIDGATRRIVDLVVTRQNGSVARTRYLGDKATAKQSE